MLGGTVLACICRLRIILIMVKKLTVFEKNELEAEEAAAKRRSDIKRAKRERNKRNKSKNWLEEYPAEHKLTRISIERLLKISDLKKQARVMEGKRPNKRIKSSGRPRKPRSRVKTARPTRRAPKELMAIDFRRSLEQNAFLPIDQVFVKKASRQAPRKAKEEIRPGRQYAKYNKYALDEEFAAAKREREAEREQFLREGGESQYVALEAEVLGRVANGEFGQAQRLGAVMREPVYVAAGVADPSNTILNEHTGIALAATTRRQISLLKKKEERYGRIADMIAPVGIDQEAASGEDTSDEEAEFNG